MIDTLFWNLDWYFWKGEATAQLSAVSDFFNMKAAGVIVNMILLATLLAKMRYYNHNQSWCSYIFMGSLFSSVALSIYQRKRTREISGQDIPSSHTDWVQMLKWPCTMAYVSTVLQMVAVAALLVLCDTIYLTVACPLVLLIVALLVFLIWRATARPGLSGIAEGASNYWVDALKKRLNDLFKLSSQAVSMGISGLLATVLAYVKSSPAGHHGPGIATTGYRSPECFMLYGIILALLVVLLSSVPPAVAHPLSKPNIVNVYMRVPAYAALLFLVAACVMAAEAILHEFVFFEFFVVATVAILCFQKELRDGSSDGPGPAQCRVAALEGVAVPESFSQFLFGFYHLQSFAALMASYAKYGGADSTHTSELFKWFVFAVLCSILTNVSRMVVSGEEKGMESMWFPKKAWTYATYFTTAVAFILQCYVVRLHPNELLNIIL